MIIENRIIEADDVFNFYYLYGHKPLPKAFIDEIEGKVYWKVKLDAFTKNHKELFDDMYWRDDLNEWTYLPVG